MYNLEPNIQLLFCVSLPEVCTPSSSASKVLPAEFVLGNVKIYTVSASKKKIPSPAIPNGKIPFAGSSNKAKITSKADIPERTVLNATLRVKDIRLLQSNPNNDPNY